MMACLVAAAALLFAGITLLVALELRSRRRASAAEFLSREDHWGGV